MAIQRYISTSFWDDAWVQSLVFVDKGLYMYFLTNPLTNIAGVYKITPRRIAFDTGLSEQEIQRIMAKFTEAGKAYWYGEYLVLPTWPSHQKWQNHANIRKGIQAFLETLKPDFIVFLDKVGYRYPLEDLMPPPEGSQTHREASESLSDTSHTDPDPSHYSDTDTHSETDINSDFDFDSNTEVPDTGGITDPRKLFMHLWQTVKDDKGMCIFQITADIEKPDDWNRFWKVSPPTCEQVEAAYKNFAAGIINGEISRRFIPATPDRFALKGGINRYQNPIKAQGKGKKAISNDEVDDHEEFFREG